MQIILIYIFSVLKTNKGWVFSTADKMILGTPVSHIGVICVQVQLRFWFPLQPAVPPGKRCASWEALRLVPWVELQEL